MAIQPRVRPTQQNADTFIGGAPDAGDAATKGSGYEKGIKKGNKRQISLTITPELLRRVDEAAARTGQGRAAIINMAIYRALEGDIFAR